MTIPGVCVDIDGGYWKGHGPGSGCQHCDAAPSPALSEEQLAFKRSELQRAHELTAPALTREALAAALLNVGISDLDWWVSEIVKGEDEAAAKLADAILAALSKTPPNPTEEAK